MIYRSELGFARRDHKDEIDLLYLNGRQFVSCLLFSVGLELEGQKYFQKKKKIRLNGEQRSQLIEFNKATRWKL